ncbi:hypothetical protein FRC17_009699, partial [Serendipita sp. 399]
MSIPTTSQSRALVVVKPKPNSLIPANLGTVDRAAVSLGSAADKMARGLGWGVDNATKGILEVLNLLSQDKHGKEDRCLLLRTLRDALSGDNHLPQLATACKHLMKKEAAQTQLCAFRKIVMFITNYPGLRRFFLHFKGLEQFKDIKIAVERLWTRKFTTDNPYRREWEFFYKFALDCILGVTAALSVEQCPIDELGILWREDQCGILGDLILEWNTRDFYEISGLVSMRYIGGILRLPTFWHEDNRNLHQHFTRTLLQRIRRFLEDVGFGREGPLGCTENVSDIEGIDIVAHAALEGVNRWSHNPTADAESECWFGEFRKWIIERVQFADLSGRTEAKKLLRNSSRLAITLFSEVSHDPVHAAGGRIGVSDAFSPPISDRIRITQLSPLSTIGTYQQKLQLYGEQIQAAAQSQSLAQLQRVREEIATVISDILVDLQKHPDSTSSSLKPLEELSTQFTILLGVVIEHIRVHQPGLDDKAINGADIVQNTPSANAMKQPASDVTDPVPNELERSTSSQVRNHVHAQAAPSPDRSSPVTGDSLRQSRPTMVKPTQGNQDTKTRFHKLLSNFGVDPVIKIQGYPVDSFALYQLSNRFDRSNSPSHPSKFRMIGAQLGLPSENGHALLQIANELQEYTRKILSTVENALRMQQQSPSRAAGYGTSKPTNPKRALHTKSAKDLINGWPDDQLRRTIPQRNGSIASSAGKEPLLPGTKREKSTPPDVFTTLPLSRPPSLLSMRQTGSFPRKSLPQEESFDIRAESVDFTAHTRSKEIEVSPTRLQVDQEDTEQDESGSTHQDQSHPRVYQAAGDDDGIHPQIEPEIDLSARQPNPAPPQTTKYVPAWRSVRIQPPVTMPIRWPPFDFIEQEING